ncbi:hypothetical protein [Paenibacillus pini]|uniref:Uncharacterized protein n=1 Tax=Paenibacillus pini JCM 16418 TaxID=1236976 RepID=W7Z1H0_9BACL|nr:hypothetical protein [Paenibacillus pini]GAF10836.1 hypothetical protein JCM16418_5061 [Paenibacillus pini JCM 16418]
MHYLDKQEAKVKIMGKLVEGGWKVFGFDPDQSDSMTDYFHPASWSGIASKNDYVLLIDICKYNLSDSGKEIRKYDYSNKKTVSHDRIQKLTAMMNDAASTENEKAACAVLIEKEMDKANVEPTYKVKEVYPTFLHANPRGTSWHIERDGQIIAKGNGVFAVNDYDWENEEKTPQQQKAEKLNAFVERIEKVLKESDALKAEVIKVPVKIIQAVEKDVTSITNNDIKDGFTIIMKAAYTHGKNKGNKYSLVYKDEKFNKYHTFYKLGKNNKPSKSFDKSWSLSVERINELLGKGHIAVIEFVEVTEYQEKIVFKKTSRKQTVSNVPTIETKEEVKETVSNMNKENEVVEPATQRQLWALHCATKLDTREMKISKIKASELITRSKEGHCIITEVKAQMNDSETSAIDKVKSNNIENEPVITEENNVIYHDFKNDDFNENDHKEDKPMTNIFNDLLNKFDNVEVTTDSKIAPDDLEFCKEQEEIYNQLLMAYNAFKIQLQDISDISVAHGKKFGRQSGTAYTHGSYTPRDIDETINKIKNEFIQKVCSYFQRKYSITIDIELIQKVYMQDVNIIYANIVEKINEQLGGFNFTEKAVHEIKEKMKEILYKYSDSNRVIVRNNKLILNGGFTYLDSIWKYYKLKDRKDCVLAGISNFDNGSVTINQELVDTYCGYNNEKDQTKYTKFEPKTLNKVRSIKFMKNGKMEIEFLSHELAVKFASEYCGYKKQSA